MPNGCSVEATLACHVDPLESCPYSRCFACEFRNSHLHHQTISEIPEYHNETLGAVRASDAFLPSAATDCCSQPGREAATRSNFADKPLLALTARPSASNVKVTVQVLHSPAFDEICCHRPRKSAGSAVAMPPERVATINPTESNGIRIGLSLADYKRHIFRVGNELFKRIIFTAWADRPSAAIAITSMAVSFHVALVAKTPAHGTATVACNTGEAYLRLDCFP